MPPNRLTAAGRLEFGSDLLEFERIGTLTRENDELRAELRHERECAARVQQVHVEERMELTESYERMLAEQAEAAKQYESRAASVGALRLEMRKREEQLRLAQAEAVGTRLRLAAVDRVWQRSVRELEGALDAEVKERKAAEAERAKFGDIQRKKLTSLQREADARSNEAKKLGAPTPVPEGQVCPAVHGPLQDGFVRSVAPPYDPAGHANWQPTKSSGLLTTRRGMYRPRGHSHGTGVRDTIIRE